MLLAYYEWLVQQQHSARVQFGQSLHEGLFLHSTGKHPQSAHLTCRSENPDPEFYILVKSIFHVYIARIWKDLARAKRGRTPVTVTASILLVRPWKIVYPKGERSSLQIKNSRSVLCFNSGARYCCYSCCTPFSCCVASGKPNLFRNIFTVHVFPYTQVTCFHASLDIPLWIVLSLYQPTL